MAYTCINVQRVLYEAGKPLQGHSIAPLLGWDTRTFNRHITHFVNAGAVSRKKIPGKAFYWYFLSDDQRAHYLLRERRADERTLGRNTVLDVMHVELPTRMQFLESLKDSAEFGSHPALAMIIADYERTMAVTRMMDVD